MPYLVKLQMMKLSAINWKKQLKDVVILVLLSIPFSYLTCIHCWEQRDLIKFALLVSALMWVTMYKGNSLVSYVIEQRVSWLESPVKRLIYGLIGHSLYTVAMVFVLKTALLYLLDINIGSVQQISLVAVGITFLFTLVLSARSFLISWRAAAIESERAKKEVITSKYETLKNQVNPHFLFNSLNALSNLVYEDADLSAKFIKKLADVYRYVLDSRDKELVTLREELACVEAYIFLQKIRHEEALRFDIEVQEMNRKVIPLAVQMLVENAIKHNVISDSEPLSISIKQKQDSLVIENTLQKKNIMADESAGVGLENIKARYEIMHHSIDITAGQQKFSVTLPLIDN